MYAPPTRAEVSRKQTRPSCAWMNSVCEAPRHRPNEVRTRSFSSRNVAVSGSSSAIVEVTKIPPSCATAIGGMR